MNGKADNGAVESPVLDIEAVARDVGAVAVPSAMRQQLVRDLGPIADALEGYHQKAVAFRVSSQTDVDMATALCDEIAGKVRVVKGHDVLSGLIRQFHAAHGRLTGLLNALVRPLEDARGVVRTKAITWVEGEKRRADDERRRLQAEADERARREREALEKKAAKYKTEEKRQAVLEQAAGEYRKEDLDLVEPGCVLGGVDEFPLGMVGEPDIDLVVCVRVEVVDDGDHAFGGQRGHHNQPAGAGFQADFGFRVPDYFQC